MKNIHLLLSQSLGNPSRISDSSSQMSGNPGQISGYPDKLSAFQEILVIFQAILAKFLAILSPDWSRIIAKCVDLKLQIVNVWFANCIRL